MGMSAQQLLQNDPEYLRRQLAAQEMQRLNPQGTAAGAIGALFGRGIGNIASNRNFFDIGDAGLRRVSDVQGIMSRAQFDPSNPAGYYEQIGKDLQAAGYGDLAPMALQEAAKFRKEAAVETRAQAAESRAASAERRASYQFNPELAIEDAGKLAEDDPQRTTLLSLAARLMEKDNFDRAAKTAQITASEADVIYKRALAGKAVKEAAQGTKQWERAGMDALGNVTLFNPFTGETKVLKGVLSESAAPASPGKPTGERKPLESFNPNAQRTSGIPEASTATASGPSNAEVDAMISDAKRGGTVGTNYIRQALTNNTLTLAQRQRAAAALQGQ